MLKANVIMYSRSLINDYRWIYSCDFLDVANMKTILYDYKEFEKNKELYLKEKHLVVRCFNDGIALYKFIETEDKDANSRKIYALLGCVFSEFEFQIVQSLCKYFSSYFYSEYNIYFEKFQRNIPDKNEGITETVEFSLDSILEYIKMNYDVKQLVNIIDIFLKQHSVKNFIIKNNAVNSISSFSMEQKNISDFKGLQDRIKSDTSINGISGNYDSANQFAHKKISIKDMESKFYEDKIDAKKVDSNEQFDSMRNFNGFKPVENNISHEEYTAKRKRINLFHMWNKYTKR